MFDSTSRPTSRRWLAVFVALFLLPPGIAGAAPILFTAAGDIQGTVDNFRAALGDPLNVKRSRVATGGRREINWDGGGGNRRPPRAQRRSRYSRIAARSSRRPAPGSCRPRPTSRAACRTCSVSPRMPPTSRRSVPLRLFVPVGSNITDGFFSVPGSGGTLPATVGGFGAVFSDVDLADTTSILFFDFNGLPIGSPFFVPVSDGGLSFVGILFDAGERIASVRITTGTTALGLADNPANGVDVVAMDDFLFQEPVPIPEPATLLLTAMGLLIGGRALRRRGKKGPESRNAEDAGAVAPTRRHLS